MRPGPFLVLVIVSLAVPAFTQQTPAGTSAALIPLAKVKTIYISPLPNDLDTYIRAEIAKQLKNRITVQLKPDGADASMIGTGDWKSGTGAAITGRWLGLHDTASGAVSLVGSDSSTVLWSSEAGDRSLWWGAMKRGGPRKVADRLVNNLKKELKRAGKI